MGTKTLTVSKTVYGVSNIPVVQLDFNNGTPMPTYELHTANAHTVVTILDSIDRAHRAGFHIEFKGFSSEGRGARGKS